jgi:hypothetical protein
LYSLNWGFLPLRAYRVDRAPPHFHAVSAGAQAKYLLDGTRLAGRLPPTNDRAVRARAAAHQPQPKECWERAADTEHPGTIDPAT